jgi:peptidoglycan hydrolase-like protein with peptidoglycan-binding domain
MLIAACVVGLLYLLSANPWLIPAVAEVGAFLIAGTRSPMLGSVGQGGQQLPADARYAQRLLNDWRGANGLPAIAVDGDPRDETIGAITLFQQTVTGEVDGRLDPDGPAIRMLEQLHIQRMLDTPTLAYAEIDTQPDLSFDERASELAQADQEGSPPLDLAVALTGEAQAQLDALYALPA